MNRSFGHFSPAGTVRFVRESEVRVPGKTVVFIDGRADDINPDSIADDFYATQGTVGLRHQSGANVAFGDGHATHIKQEIRMLAAPAWHVEGDPRQTLIWNLP